MLRTSEIFIPFHYFRTMRMRKMAHDKLLCGQREESRAGRSFLDVASIDSTGKMDDQRFYR